jgi:hypothetical protein
MTVLAAGAALTSAQTSPSPAASTDFPILELRQYTLHERQRETLIDLFEREFEPGSARHEGDRHFP